MFAQHAHDTFIECSHWHVYACHAVGECLHEHVCVCVCSHGLLCVAACLSVGSSKKKERNQNKYTSRHKEFTKQAKSETVI